MNLLLIETKPFPPFAKRCTGRQYITNIYIILYWLTIRATINKLRKAALPLMCSCERVHEGWFREKMRFNLVCGMDPRLGETATKINSLKIFDVWGEAVDMMFCELISFEWNYESFINLAMISQVKVDLLGCLGLVLAKRNMKFVTSL